jgi:hypothetical protein
MRHNAKFAGFIDAVMTFPRKDAPSNWPTYCNTVPDNFRVISRSDFRVGSSRFPG